MPSFMTVGIQMPELDRWGGFFAPPPPYKLGGQNTTYKIGLKLFIERKPRMSRLSSL